MRRDSLYYHCHKWHKTYNRALKPNEQPVKPMYSNIEEVLKDPLNVFPQPILGYDPIMGKKEGKWVFVDKEKEILDDCLHPELAKQQVKEDIEDV